MQLAVRIQAQPQGDSQLVFDKLHMSILSLTLAPGAELSRAALQKRFAVSSTPVRDALMRLEEIGLVDVFPQSGTIVSLIDVSKAKQAQFLRRSIELEAVHTLASSPDEGVVSSLQAVIAEQKARAKAGDLKRFNESDLTFHRILFDAAGIPDLWALVRRHSGHIDRIRRLHLPVKGKTAQIVRDHTAILHAIEAADPKLAQRKLREHLSQSLAYTKELRMRFPAYFKE